MVDWIEIIGPVIVNSLAEKHSLQLSQNLINFLNNFGNRVETASKTRQTKARRAARALSELDIVNDHVEQEVENLRKNIMGGKLDNKQYFFVRSHPETYLPIVHLRLKGLPEIVIHVNRSYANRKKGISFGFRLSDFGQPRLTGKIAQAANYLREKCRKADWQLSVTDVLQIWIQRVKHIPLHERGPTMLTHPPVNYFPAHTPVAMEENPINNIPPEKLSSQPLDTYSQSYLDDIEVVTPSRKRNNRKHRTSFRVVDDQDYVHDVDHDQESFKQNQNTEPQNDPKLAQACKSYRLHSEPNNDKNVVEDQDHSSTLQTKKKFAVDEKLRQGNSNLLDNDATEKQKNNLKRRRDEHQLNDNVADNPPHISKRIQITEHKEESYMSEGEISDGSVETAKPQSNKDADSGSGSGDVVCAPVVRGFKFVDDDGDFTLDNEENQNKNENDAMIDMDNDHPATESANSTVIPNYQQSMGTKPEQYDEQKTEHHTSTQTPEEDNTEDYIMEHNKEKSEDMKNEESEGTEQIIENPIKERKGTEQIIENPTEEGKGTEQVIENPTDDSTPQEINAEANMSKIAQEASEEVRNDKIESQANLQDDEKRNDKITTKTLDKEEEAEINKTEKNESVAEERESNHSSQDDSSIPVVDLTKGLEQNGMAGSSTFTYVDDVFNFGSEIDRRDTDLDIDLNIDKVLERDADLNISGDGRVNDVTMVAPVTMNMNLLGKQPHSVETGTEEPIRTPV